MHLHIIFLITLVVRCCCDENPLDSLRYENARVERDLSISLSVSPDKLKTNGLWVSVSWSGVSSPNESDWIGVYLPHSREGIDPGKQAPVKYQYCYHFSTHLSKGEGWLEFYLVNMRTSYLFGFLRNGFNNPTLVATSEPVHFDNPNEPLQGHLMLTGDPTQMKLVWVSKDSNNPILRYGAGIAGGQFTKVHATSETYDASSLCGRPANETGFIDPGQLHTAVMENLSPGQRIHYQFGDGTWSKLYNFTVPPQNGPDSITRIIAYGDMGHAQPDSSSQAHGGDPPSRNTTRLIEREVDTTDLILHIGDISYANGYAAVWDEFFDMIEPIATRVPYMVCIGNHERDFPNSGSYYTSHDSGGECGVPHNIRFPMPKPARDQNWYTFKIGNIQVVLMSTEHNFTTGSVQYNWIKDTLSKVDRKQTPWLIFAGHRPMYCDSNDEGYENSTDNVNNVGRELRTSIEPLLKEYKVDLALWGHHHSYQRTCPIYQERCMKGSPVHLIIGMAGHHLSHDIYPVKPDWVEQIDTKHFGYSRIATNCTHLVVEFVSNIDGKVRDTLVLENTDRCLEAHNVRKESFSMAGVLSTAVQLLSNLGHYIF